MNSTEISDSKQNRAFYGQLMDTHLTIEQFNLSIENSFKLKFQKKNLFKLILI